MGSIVIRNASIWDATGAPAFPGEVLIEGNTIKTIAPAPATIPANGAVEIDAAGKTLMPGLVEGHAHLTFPDVGSGPEMGVIPPEEHTLITMHNAKKILDAGFTSAYGAASAKLRLDIVIRNEINAGLIPGPRMRAATPEITVTGSLGDDNLAHMPREGFAIVANGVDEIVKTVRLGIREGVDNIKINISGRDFDEAHLAVMKDEEVRAAAETAHEYGKKISAHARASESVKLALKHGVDVIYHCDFVDEEALDMLEEAKDRVICAPAFGLLHAMLYESEDVGLTEADAEAWGIRNCLEESAKAHVEMHKRGVRIAIGGDYGFIWNNQGKNARDIEHFVNYFGMTPVEALQSATKVGGELMGIDVGMVREGWLADLLLVDGDPVADVKVLQDSANLSMIMKDGELYKAP